MKKVCVLLALMMCHIVCADLIIDLSFSGDSMENFGTAGETAFLSNGSPMVFTDGVATARAGVDSRALDLHGITDNITLGSLAAGQGGVIDALNGLQSFTICFWVKGEKLLNSAPVWRRENSGLYDYNIQARTDQYSRQRAVVNKVWSSPATNGWFGYENTWAFFAMTYDSSLATEQVGFYRNDASSTSAFLHGIRQTAAGGPVNASDYPIWFGTNCNVVIDNIKVYGSKTDSSGDLSSNDSLKWVYWGDMFTEEVPEPATMTLLALGAMAFAVKRKK